MPGHAIKLPNFYGETEYHGHDYSSRPPFSSPAMEKTQYFIQYRLPQSRTWHESWRPHQTAEKVLSLLARLRRTKAKSPVRFRAVRKTITVEVLDED